MTEAKLVQIKDKQTGRLSKPVGLHPDIAKHRIAAGEAVAYPPKKQNSRSPLKEKTDAQLRNNS